MDILYRFDQFGTPVLPLRAKRNLFFVFLRYSGEILYVKCLSWTEKQTQEITVLESASIQDVNAKMRPTLF